MSSLWGRCFRLMSFGESHGAAVGGVVDGCPAGVTIDTKWVQQQLRRRQPGHSPLSSPRKEPDEIIWLSGLEGSLTLGSPIAWMVQNKDAKKADYKELRNLYRPSHSDYTYKQKYGFLASSGSGRASARETLARVVAGALAEQFLKQVLPDFCITAYTQRVGHLELKELPQALNREQVDASAVRCPDLKASQSMERFIEEVKAEGDSIGGEIRCLVSGVPPGLGEPVFDKLHADLSKAMISIPAARYFMMGSGYHSTTLQGSENNDVLQRGAGGSTVHSSNRCGGVEGGMSNGAPLIFSVGFKPPSSIFQEQKTLTHEGQPITYQPQTGRHDPCVLPRAVPIVEAMACLTLADHYMAAHRGNVKNLKP